MTLKNGKFYDSDGNVVPLEFGNQEQIDLLARVEVLRSEGEFLERDYIVSKDETHIVGVCYSWDCLCGNKVRAHIRENMDGRKYKCEVCGMRYQTGFDKDFDELMFKLIS